MATDSNAACVWPGREKAEAPIDMGMLPPSLFRLVRTLTFSDYLRSITVRKRPGSVPSVVRTSPVGGCTSIVNMWFTPGAVEVDAKPPIPPPPAISVTELSLSD